QAQRATRRTPSTSTGFQPVPWHSGQSFCAIEVFQWVGTSVFQFGKVTQLMRSTSVSQYFIKSAACSAFVLCPSSLVLGWTKDKGIRTRDYGPILKYRPTDSPAPTRGAAREGE